MFTGICYAAMSCFMWAFVFIIPSYLSHYNSVEIALGRFMFYSIASIIFLLLKNLNFPKYSFKIWFKAFIFSLAAIILYYIFVVACIKCSSPLIPMLIFSLNPIVVVFYETLEKDSSRLKLFLFPLILTLVGLLLVNYSKNLEITYDYMFGILLSLLPLAIRCWFIIANSSFLREETDVTSDWGALIGTVTLFWVILFSILGLWTGHLTFEKFNVVDNQFWLFLGGSAVLGILCTFFANILWNIASCSLPVTTAVQLTILESIFGILFIFLIGNKMPEILEIIGVIFVISSIMYGFTIQSKEKQQAVA